jgi:Vanadium chloroperoxidase N-terminal domain/PAP2 superfamily
MCEPLHILRARFELETSTGHLSLKGSNMENPISFWNDVAMECNRLDHTGMMKGRNQQGPTLSSRALAIVHIAIHDAYVLAKRHIGSNSAFNDLYLPQALLPAFNKPAAEPAKLVSATVSAAASAALLSLYPALQALINSSFDRICSLNGDEESGHRLGLEVARAIIRLRSNDGSSTDPDPESPAYMDSAAYGRHREDPLNRNQPFLGSNYGQTRLFACNQWHVLKPFPQIGSAAYLADHREVRIKGAASSAKIVDRKPDETALGLYWAYDGANEIGTPPRLYNQIIRKVAALKGLDTDQLNRLLLLVNLSMADAGVIAWFYKYHFDLWRPVIGIREYDTSMGLASISPGNPLNADTDPFWRPLGAPRTNMADASVRTFTPPFPAYPSGHATFGAAAFQATRLFLKKIGKATLANAKAADNIAFDFVSDELNGKSLDPDDTVRSRHVRKFNGLHEAIYENSVSRIYLGVHWRFDGTSAQSALAAMSATDQIGGVPLGLAIAEDIVGQANINPSPATAKAPAFEATPD